MHQPWDDPADIFLFLLITILTIETQNLWNQRTKRRAYDVSELLGLTHQDIR